MSRPALLDVNVLVALFQPDHIHHEIAHDWFADHRHDGWATSPLTANGFVRILSHPSTRPEPLRPAEVVSRLRRFCTSGHHVFWPDVVSLQDTSLFNESFILGHRQITDVYLLGLAKHMNGLLATFDRAIPLSAVIGATHEHVAILTGASE